MAESKVVTGFRQLIEKVFSQKTEHIADQVDFNDKYQRLFTKEYQAALKIVVSTKDSAILVQLMNVYLELYSRYSYNANSIHFYMSDITFQLLIAQSARVDSNHGDLFDIWDKVLTGNAVSDSYNSFKKRYVDLSKTVRSYIDAFRVAARKKKAEQKSILDKLKDEYARQFGYPAKTMDDLYGFDPKTNIQAKCRLEAQTKNIETIWNSAQGKEVWEQTEVMVLNVLLDAFNMYIKQESRGDVLVLFQILKYLKEVYTSTREVREDKRTHRTETYIHDPEPHKAALYYVLYTMTCTRLMAVAQATQLYTRNRFGFTEEEKTWFLKPIRASYQYYSNLERIIKTRLDGKVTVEVLVEELKVFLNMCQLTKCQLKGIDWVGLKETMKIQKIWKDINEFTEAIDYAVKGANAGK
ncbi:hypothetical protein, partial [Chitinophaga sp.]|uniref:hypothetical protein n=1 Tax=Chitinophaga sp. TaxID=1869181 RepID=UPI002F926CAF